MAILGDHLRAGEVDKQVPGFLSLQRTQVWLPESMLRGSQLPVMVAPACLTTSSGLQGYARMYAQTHGIDTLMKILKKQKTNL